MLLLADDPTGSLAYIVRKEVPGLEVFGGVDLNLTVGGMNPAAVEHMTQVSGGWGRLVWMSTFDAENQVRYSKETRPFVAVSSAAFGLTYTIVGAPMPFSRAALINWVSARRPEVGVSSIAAHI